MPDTLATSYLPEIDAAFPVMLNDRWRVVDDPLQWVLQYRARMRGRSDGTDDPRSVGRETLLPHQRRLKMLHTGMLW